MGGNFSWVTQPGGSNTPELPGILLKVEGVCLSNADAQEQEFLVLSLHFGVDPYATHHSRLHSLLAALQGS